MSGQVKDFLMLVLCCITVALLITVRVTLLTTSDSSAEEQAQAQSTPGKEIHMNEVIRTKSHANDKMFYYVQLLEDKPQETYRRPSHEDIDDMDWPEGNDHSLNRRNISGRDNTGQVRLTIQLGHVPDGSERFVVADALYTSSGGSVFSDAVGRSELQRWPAQLCEAVGVAEARYEAGVRTALLKLQQWLDNRTGPAPALGETEVIALQELHRLKTRLFSNRYANSPGDRAQCGPGYTGGAGDLDSHHELP